MYTGVACSRDSKWLGQKKCQASEKHGLDDQLFRYFGARELTEVPNAAHTASIDRMLVDFGMASDSGQRFALWCLLHMLGSAPDLDVAFKNEADREAARNFMDLLAAQS